MSEARLLHRVIRRMAAWAVWSFFTELHVIGGENVPKDGPIIVAATHHNMMLDPAILSTAFPHSRILHYWSKASLFANPFVSYILTSTGNIPVDRKSKDRQVLFKGTFETLSKGLVVALFPEGTSYTEPRIMQVKDGAAWVALEYMNWANRESPRDVVIVPAAIVYTNKSKYRSNVILEFGRPITVEPYKEQFLSNVEGASRAAVKRLTRAIEKELVEATINSPDWDTLYAARMARDLMWEDPTTMNLDDFVAISQTLVDLFSTNNPTPNFPSVKRRLLEYYSLLQSTKLTNSVLSNLPLPRTLDPNHPTPLPSRLYTLFILIRDSVAILPRLPFFFFPLLFHLPVYIMARLGARLAEDEEETQAQNKVVIGLLLCLMMYFSTFYVLWALFWFTPIGALSAASMVWLLAVYHNKIINDSYEHAKRLVATWRVLMGVWAPKRWELPLAALSQYTTPATPKANPWIDGPKVRGKGGETTDTTTKTETPGAETQKPAVALPEPSLSLLQDAEPPVRARPVRPRSRQIMRHVLRARAEAVRALAAFFEQLGDAGSGIMGVPVRASPHLARAYGGWVFDNAKKTQNGGGGGGVGWPDGVEEEGWRHAREVVAFLRRRGGKIATLRRGIEGGWAALGTDVELSPADDHSDVTVEKDDTA